MDNLLKHHRYPILAAASCGKGGKAEAYMRQQDGIMLSQP